MTQIVTSQVEFEGRVYERHTLWSGVELSPWSSNEQLAIVGRPVERVDALAKVTGQAIYTADLLLPGMLYAAVLRSPVAHARIRRVDVGAASAAPGVRAAICHRNTPAITLAHGQPLFDRTVRYVGQAIAAVAADSEDAALDALRSIVVSYDPLPFVTEPAEAARDGAPLVHPCGNRPPQNNPRIYERGNVVVGEAEADTVVEVQVTTHPVVHECFEPHCAVCRWEGDELTIWTSTQGVQSVAENVSRLLGIRQSRIRVISTVIGGGFGSKLMAGEEVLIPALLARQTNCPVKLTLDRRAESVATGHRPSTTQRIRLGARRDGTLTFVEHDVTQGMGSYGHHEAQVTGPAQELYRCPNVRTAETVVYTNLAPARPFRGPGFTEGTFALESAMDELARILRQDPLELRQRNQVDFDQTTDQPYSSNPLDEVYAQGAAASGWCDPKATPSRSERRRGRGMATQIWGGGGGPPAYAWIELKGDGTADVVVGSQDIGTGTRTALAQIAAEELGLRLADVVVDEGDSRAGPYAPSSGGSQTISSVGPAVRVAAKQVRDGLLQVAARELKQSADALSVREGEICFGPAGEQKVSVSSLLSRSSPSSLVGQGDRSPNPKGVTIRTFGAHFAEVEVDVETGEVFLLRYVAIHDCGRIISPLQARSQISGGVTQGIGYALTEEQIVDLRTGVPLNPNLEDYLIPTIADVPDVCGRPLGDVDQIDNSLGVKGLGEPPIIPVAPAIANAIADAIGVRIVELPLTRARILAAIEKMKGMESAHARF